MSYDPPAKFQTRRQYIGGTWSTPSGELLDVVNPSTEEVVAELGTASETDVENAVAAAKAAASSFAATSVEDRINLLERICDGFEQRKEELARAISLEMGAPLKVARDVHYPSGPAHIREMIRVLKLFSFEEQRGTTLLAKEPVGVCALITPWNFPINQVMVKVVPALAAGCTIVLKPSELSPLSAYIIAEILEAAQVPPGVFNLVNGPGSRVGAQLVAHRDVRMVSFTGSTQAGIAVAQQAAKTVKRVAQELGGKSANILLDDVDLAAAVSAGVKRCFNNSGQSCISPTRMLVPSHLLKSAVEIAAEAAASLKVGPACSEDVDIGPVVSRAQFEKIQQLISAGVSEGARLAAGGAGRPQGLDRGYFVRPTVFVDVDPEMVISQTEIFGPVLSIIAYEDEDDAVRIANGTPFGLAAYIQSANIERARAVAKRMEAGVVQLNYPAVDRGAPFGGYKQSGNGREWGEFGLYEYLELKSIVGHG